MTANKLTTDDCRKWLAASPVIKKLVKDRSGVSDGEEDALTEWVIDAADPKKWTRQSKVKVGSKTDKDDMNYADPFFANQLGFPLTGGVVRTFWLKGTDHVTVSILELNGSLHFLDDLSD